MMAQVQEELNKSLQELCTNMRTYHSYHMESQGAENRLRGSERQLSAQPGASGLRKLQRNRDKWHEKYSDNKLRTSKARNEYLLSLCSVNAALDQCYGIDLQHVADLCNLGFYACLTRTFRTYLSAEYGLNESRNQSLDLLENGVNELETGAHRARFLESTFAGNTNSIAPPVFLFQTHTGDEVCQITAQEPIQGELVTRYEGIKQRLTGLRTENEEVKKTMDASLQYLQNLVNTDDYNVSSLFQDLDPEGSPVASPPEPFGGKASLESRHKQLETETFFLEKFKAFMATSNVITKLQAKQELIQKTLGEDESSSSSSTRPPSIPPKPTKCKRLRPCSRVPISLFCGDLDSYIKESGQTIPLVVESCVRYINLYGLQHEGIFRVPGSQAEVNKLRNAFERGEDPLEDGEMSCDIDSVAGVLKLYFRTLQIPMFPKCMLSEFLACNKIVDVQEQTEQLMKLVSELPLTKIIVLRFLFAFLSHLSHFRDENMMDPSNLAICFGPTLMPVPEDLDPVGCQPHVNDIITAIITHHEAVFPGPNSLPGPLYEACMIPDFCDHSELDTTAAEELAQDGTTEASVSEKEVNLSETVAKIDDLEHSPQISDDLWKSRPSRVEHDSCAMPDSVAECKRPTSLSSLDEVSWQGEAGMHFAEQSRPNRAPSLEAAKRGTSSHRGFTSRCSPELRLSGPDPSIRAQLHPRPMSLGQITPDLVLDTLHEPAFWRGIEGQTAVGRQLQGTDCAGTEVPTQTTFQLPPQALTDSSGPKKAHVGHQGGPSPVTDFVSQ
uniref:SLIT-ROBO Rho GTPase-activating protein 1-like n=1 Tax=Myxine glutinosa TaxID=7769 RepID=UPI00358DED69